MRTWCHGRRHLPPERGRRYAMAGIVLGVFALTLALAGCGGAQAGGGERVGSVSPGAGQGAGEDGAAAVSSANWIGPLVKIQGTIYLLSDEPPVTEDRLAGVIARVERKLDHEQDVQDGDSNFLDAGTPIYALQGVDVAEAVAAEYQGRFVVLRPNLHPGETGTLR
ncbi:hypothetical protein E1B22_11485 [Thermaerobacter sp. FW80]|uniref:hypothetical protein n=1 Tax=Thermaerobacter sp. FW80 TaxID=2546351 RepID=UPI001074D6A5|nr:hypothetical protein [Thermaerobacter sp. FW80]QBS38264.1 hypothetical protein E1B22_11485 [Thermaerobacter sp. FW80]